MSLEFVDIQHAYGTKEVLRGISLEAMAGEVTCLLGPSGCGKTTLLKLAAGINQVQAGEVKLDQTLLATASDCPPPEKRPVGLVFQEGALFPHMTVSENIGFGISTQQDASERVTELLQQIGLVGYGDAFPGTLSGGQQQRVALARAMAPKPRVLLLDEPFASVDVVLRRSLREETRRLLKSRNAVTLIVTHDPEEAMDMADRVAVMENGKIIQVGRPDEIYSQPATAPIAAMFGEGQLIKAQIDGAEITTPFGRWPVEALHTAPTGSGATTLVARPESLSLSPAADGLTIEDIRIQGTTRKIMTSNAAGERLVAVAHTDQTFEIGQTVQVVPQSASVFAYSQTR